MVHGLQFLHCKNGHILPISLDRNECGCHHNGKPCIMLICTECLKEYTKNLKGTKAKDYSINEIAIPLDEDGMKEINKLLKGKSR